jgi:hypothetical protein
LFFSLRPVMWDIFLDMIPPSHGRDVGTNSSSLVLYSTRHGHMKPETRLSISVKPSYPSYSWHVVQKLTPIFSSYSHVFNMGHHLTTGSCWWWS